MANIVAFDNNAQLPAFLAQAQTNNDDLASHASQGFPSISIKGKVFTIVSGGERHVLPNPKDPDSPATRINVVIVKACPDKSKTYYAGGYKEGSTGEEARPTCFSNNGKLPDPAAVDPQCETCAACRWNVFGTSRGADGSMGKGKACADFVRIVVCTPDDPETLYLLRVPPASIKALGELSKTLNARHVPYQGVVTEISFDMKEATPRLVFTPRGFVADAALFNRILEQSQSEQCHRMIYGNEDAATPQRRQVPIVVEQEAEKIVQTFESETRPAKPQAQPKPQQADALIAQAMGGSPAGAPSNATPAQTVPPAAPTSKPAVIDSDDGLAAALAGVGFDD